MARRGSEAAQCAGAAAMIARGRRLTIYLMLSGQHLMNYGIRLSLPILVSFLSAERRFNERQLALLLNSFTPGYVLTQIPAARLTHRFGAKAVLSMNNVAQLIILASLPLAGRQGGAWRVAVCIAAMGFLQGPYQTSCRVSRWAHRVAAWLLLRRRRRRRTPPTHLTPAAASVCPPAAAHGCRSESCCRRLRQRPQ